MTIPPHAVLRMRVGGGEATDFARQGGVRLYVDGRLVHVTSGRNSEKLLEHTLDLSPYQGRSLVIDIFDHAHGHFGHVLVDEMALLRNVWYERSGPHAKATPSGLR